MYKSPVGHEIERARALLGALTSGGVLSAAEAAKAYEGWVADTNDQVGVAIWSLQAASHCYLVHCQQDLLKSVPQGQYGRLTCLKQGDMDERGSRVMAELNCPPKTLKKGLFPSHLSPPHGRR